MLTHLFLLTSASDLPVRTIKLCSVLFGLTVEDSLVSSDGLRHSAIILHRRNVNDTATLQMLGMEKLEWCGYPMLKNFEDISLVSTEYTNVPDGHRTTA